eukprot:CAMPEP_0181132396 /NCGR_PEP_ID=MMETSP1071-20121207/30971_1 /TAXON_ID=35127 /ORGANISM="Thalassiosira sp., Strain NH16" /LENGTH=367 /DNA_ID=CAMNT_0023218723 /DNA_START=105 /DNA_END=1205 /DNA_ORIENTATION=-
MMLCAVAAVAATSLAASNSRDFHIAPMQCYTNQPFRKLSGMLSPSSIKWSEMEKVDDLMPNTEEALEKRLGGEEQERDNNAEEKNLVLQLGSNDVTKLDACVRVATRNFPNLIRELNLNCGCPAIDTGGASSYGASLMKDAPLTARLVESMAVATDNIDISVKCRIGVFDGEEDVRSLGEKDYQYLSNYILTIHDAGQTRHFIPQPVKNRRIPVLDYDIVNRIEAEFHDKVKITLNGGINSLSELHSLQADDGTKKISSHMAGRWCLRRPLDLMAVEQTLLGKQRATVATVDPCKVIDRYIEYALAKKQSKKYPMSELCLPLFLVVEQLRYDYDQEEESGLLLSWEDMENLHDTIQDGLVHMSDGKV